MSYTAPVKDMLFVMKELAGIDDIAALPGFEDANLDTAQAILEESARLCGEVLAPLNVEGDRNPSTWKEGVVNALFLEGFQGLAAELGSVEPSEDPLADLVELGRAYRRYALVHATHYQVMFGAAVLGLPQRVHVKGAQDAVSARQLLSVTAARQRAAPE